MNINLQSRNSLQKEEARTYCECYAYIPKKLPSRKKKPVEELPVPSYLLAAFKKNKQAETAFKNFAPSHRREYILWLTEAKTDETRDKRLAQAIEWMAEGKPRNWKYMKK